MPTAIEFDNVGKQYRLGLVSTQTLSHDLHRWWTVNVRHKEDPYLRIGETNDRSVKGSSDYVWALKDISFKVEQGDVVGIIGRNGAGKSTLLKLLSKVTGPTTGQIRARGRIGSLLEVGTGFHPEMTGRENIFMNGAILGMTKAEVARKLDEIVDFSGCERYLDTPVKRYSSGMMVRLGFAVAAHLDPEILVVDEVLAVGDAEFQKKAIGKMKDVSQGQGRTVLFVSHNMDAVKALCKNGIVLNQGLVSYSGSAEDSVDYYLNNSIPSLCQFVSADGHHTNNFDREIEFISVKLINETPIVSVEEPLVFEFEIKNNSFAKNQQVQIGIIVNNEKQDRVGAGYSHPFTILDKDTFTVRIVLSNHNLSKGRYSFDFALSQFNYVASFRDFDAIYNTISIEVEYLDRNHEIHFSTWPKQLGSCCFLSLDIDQIG